MGTAQKDIGLETVNVSFPIIPTVVRGSGSMVDAVDVPASVFLVDEAGVAWSVRTAIETRVALHEWPLPFRPTRRIHDSLGWTGQLKSTKFVIIGPRPTGGVDDAGEMRRAQELWTFIDAATVVNGLPLECRPRDCDQRLGFHCFRGNHFDEKKIL